MQQEVSKNLRIFIYDSVLALISDMNIHDRWNRLYSAFYAEWNIADLNNIPEIKSKKISKLDYLELRPHLMAKLVITMLRMWSKFLVGKVP